MYVVVGMRTHDPGFYMVGRKYWIQLECFEKNQNLQADEKYQPTETLIQRCVYEGSQGLVYLMRRCYFNRRMGGLIRPETSPNAPQLTDPPYTVAGTYMPVHMEKLSFL